MPKLAPLGALLLPLASPLVAVVEACPAQIQEATVETEAADSAAAPSITPIATVAADPASYRGVELRLVGQLDNEGKNYFTDLRVVLKDEEGAFLYVWPWLPAHLPPSPPGATGERPEVLSDYLGKRVELLATVEERTLRSVGEVFALVVEEATVLAPSDG